VAGALRLPSFLADNMVLQRGNATLWGWDAPGNTVSIRAVDVEGDVEIFSGSAMAGADDGAWRVSVPVAEPHGNVTVTVTSGDEIAALRNVAFGDVYLCSGQSNMVYPVADAENGEAERANSSYPLVRLLTLQKVQASTPATDIASAAPYIWGVSSPETLSPRHQGNYPSAVCWFAGRDIHLALEKKVPIGLITVAWSGSQIDSWMLPDMLADGTPPELGGNGTCGGTRPGSHSSRSISAHAKGDTMFDGMIAPLLPMRLTGIWWYQGEANDIGKSVARAGPWWYSCLFPSMIKHWREAFDAPELPFYYVLLTPGHSALLREAQTAAGLLPATAFASSLDLRSTNDEMADGFEPGHPIRKQEIGRRIALAALANIYGANVTAVGPIVETYELQRGISGGLAVTLRFNPASAQGLHTAGLAVCNECCNGTGGAGSPVTFSDPDAGSLLHPASKVFASSFEVDSVTSTLVASVPSFQSSQGRVQVEFLFENAPQCGVYNGKGGFNDHQGIVGQSWRVNTTLPSPSLLV